MYQKVKKKVYELLNPSEGGTGWDKTINTFLILLIILNVIAVMLETVKAIHSHHKTEFRAFDTFSVAVFTIEYILRVWSCNCNPKYKHPVFGRLRYIVSPGAIIDLMSFLPFYVRVAVGFDLRILRIFRLFRILRIFRLTAYMKSTQLILNVFKSKFNELVLSFILTFFLIIIAACLMYFTEHPGQPDKFTSIPATIWWAITTLTTVGYGDVVPMTVLGKILTSVILLGGVALLALPAGIITSGFFEEVRKTKGPDRRVCPHCGKSLDDVPLHEH